MKPISLEVVLKLTGFCNMRCPYCYEWDRLSDRTRMPTELLQTAVEGFTAFADRLLTRMNAPVRLSFILHGGEPLILPPAYLKQILQILQEKAAQRAETRIAVQTNAVRLSDNVLKLIEKHRVDVSVSHDVVEGSRVNAAGKSVNAQINTNILLLRDLGFLRGGITVVNLITAKQLEAVHEYWQSVGVLYRLLPLFAHGGPRMELYGLREEESADALVNLFERLLDRGKPINMAPLDKAFATALTKIAEYPATRLKTPSFGRSAMVVNTDGRVYEQTATDYASESSLGDINLMSVDDILSGPGVSRLRAHDAALLESVCAECELADSCARWPLFLDGLRTTRCGVSYHLMRRMVEVLRGRGIDSDAARAAIAAAKESQLAA